MVATGTKELFSEEKRANTFMVGTRYGRAGGSGETRLRIQKSSSEKVVKPRKDSFYVPRYGKRSSTSMTYPFSGTVHTRFSGTEVFCIYSGVADFYRCVKKREAEDGDQSSDK